MKHLSTIVLLFSVFVSTASAADKLNILVIVADDLGYGDIGVHGGKVVPTPNIDALAASGVRCTSGYVSCPYCSPTRAGFLTGRYQTHFGHEFNPHVGDETTLGLPLDQRTIADHLHTAGFATALIGKWHQGFNAAHHPQSRGFDEFLGFLVGGHNFILHKDAEPMFGSAHSHDMIYRGREVQKLDGYTTDLFTDEAIKFIDRQTAKPWFLYLAYNAVHTPLEIVEKHKSRIPTDITDPNRRGYLSLLLGLDDAIGRLTAHLSKTEHDKDTLVFFFSDNGGSGRKPFFAYNTGVNTPLRGNKGQTLEGGIRVPFFVSWPGKLPAGKVYDQPVIALDVLPTALKAAEVKVPANCDGIDLLPHLKGETNAPPHTALYWRFGPQKAVRRGQWKLVDWRDHDAKKTAAGSCTTSPGTLASRTTWLSRSRSLLRSSAKSGTNGTPRTSPPSGTAARPKIHPHPPRRQPRRSKDRKYPDFDCPEFDPEPQFSGALSLLPWGDSISAPAKSAD